MQLLDSLIAETKENGGKELPGKLYLSYMTHMDSH